MQKLYLILVSIFLLFLLSCIKNTPSFSPLQEILITPTSASFDGNIIYDEDPYDIKDKGVCWSKSEDTKLKNNSLSKGPGAGSFVVQLTDLELNTKYFIRPYATTSRKTYYGSEKSFTTHVGPFEVGQYYGGGVIAFIFQPGHIGYKAGEAHGLIVTTSDQSAGIQWYNGNFTYLGITSLAIGTGQENTIKIVNAQGEGNYAAKLCYDLVLNGYDDWYLPSRDDLILLYKNMWYLPNFGPPNYPTYWSSSEYNPQSAEAYSLFSTGTDLTAEKSFKYHVRAVRSF